MANNLLQQAQQLKIMIEQVKQQSLVAKETTLSQMRQQIDKEKQEVRETVEWYIDVILMIILIIIFNVPFVFPERKKKGVCINVFLKPNSFLKLMIGHSVVITYVEWCRNWRK